MNVPKAIYKLLSQSGPVAAIVGTNIFPLKAPQNKSFPYITYQTISRIPAKFKDGPAILDTFRVQVNIFSETFKQGSELSELVRAALDWKESQTLDSKIQHIHFDQENNLFEDDADIYGVAQDYFVRMHRG